MLQRTEWRPDFLTRSLLNEVIHRGVSADTLHHHSQVRISLGEYYSFFSQLPVYGQEARELVLLHHESVRPNLDQRKQLHLCLFPSGAYWA